MAEHLEGPVESGAGPNGAPDPAVSTLGGEDAVPPAAGPAQRAAALWKLLGDDLGTPASVPPDDAPAPVRETGSADGAASRGWGESELGELLARAWFEATDADSSEVAATEPGWDQPASWGVDPMPTAERGGVLGLFTGAGSPLGPDERAVSDPQPPRPAPPGDAIAPPGRGRALLAEMIEQLPTEPTPRVSPDDIEIDPPVVAPVAIWFWGDDDIYPGLIASGGPAAKPRPGRRSARSNAAPAPSRESAARQAPATASAPGQPVVAADPGPRGRRFGRRRTP